MEPSQKSTENYIATGIRTYMSYNKNFVPKDLEDEERQLTNEYQQLTLANMNQNRQNQIALRIEEIRVLKQQLRNQQANNVPLGGMSEPETNIIYSIYEFVVATRDFLIDMFRRDTIQELSQPNINEIRQEIENRFDQAETPRNIYVPKESNDGKGSPDPDSSNYDPSATEDNGKSRFSDEGTPPPLDHNSPGSAAGGFTYLFSSGCGYGVTFANYASRFAFGLIQGTRDALNRIFNYINGFSRFLGVGSNSLGSPQFTRINNADNYVVNPSDVNNMYKFNAVPNTLNGDKSFFNLNGIAPVDGTNSGTSNQQNIRDIPTSDYTNPEKNPYIPAPGDPDPIYPINPVVPPRNGPTVTVPFKPGSISFNVGPGYSSFIPGNLNGDNNSLKTNPWNNTWTYAAANSGLKKYNGISDTIYFDDHDGQNLYINGSRLEDIFVKFEHGKAVKFDCSRLSRKHAIGIYKTLVPSISVMPSFDYDNAFWYSREYIYDVGDYRYSHQIIFNNNPYTGVYGGNIYIDISAYLENVNSEFTMRYGSLYNHQYPNPPGFKYAPFHDNKAIWYYKVVNKPSLSGRIVFIPKNDPGNTFHITLTSITANNIEYKKYAVSKDNMNTWFIPTNDNKLMLSYTRPYSANAALFRDFCYTFILTNIPATDALYIGGTTKMFSENTEPLYFNVYGYTHSNYTSLAQGIYFPRYNQYYPYQGLDPSYVNVGTWELSGTHNNYNRKTFYSLLSAQPPGVNPNNQPIFFYHTSASCGIGLHPGASLNPANTNNVPLTSTAPYIWDQPWTAPVGFINSRYVTKFIQENNISHQAGCSAIQLAGMYTNQNFCIGIDKNSVPLSHRIPYSYNIRPAFRAQSITKWWDSEGIWGANNLAYDYDYESQHNPSGYKTTNPNVKFFTKTTQSNSELGSYKMIRDFYVQGVVPPIIGRFILDSALVGNKIGINLSGKYEPEVVATVEVSPPGAGATTMYFVKR